ncbi:hypothetical protein TELCIR_00245 [Teladorsagia circumcincta]|uniref:Uncharacterized protein n=1 Tax=Teladorsagia circumcincta TaxID=45464 RepID=A0A2G9V586_TELCI|nr:hypothetical protein TELCIR_00245 [Teladorsagia circumcincta]
MKTLINVYENYRESHPNDDIRIDGFTPPDYVKYILDEYNASKDVERKNRASTSSVRFNYSQFMYEYHFGIHSKCYNSNDTSNGTKLSAKKRTPLSSVKSVRVTRTPLRRSNRFHKL